MNTRCIVTQTYARGCHDLVARSICDCRVVIGVLPSSWGFTKEKGSMVAYFSGNNRNRWLAVGWDIDTIKPYIKVRPVKHQGRRVDVGRGVGCRRNNNRQSLLILQLRGGISSSRSKGRTSDVHDDLARCVTRLSGRS